MVLRGRAAARPRVPDLSGSVPYDAVPHAKRPSRILLIRPSALGDVCRSVHVLARLRAAFPKARIDWLVQDSFADAVRHHPALSNVVPFPRRRLGRQLKRLRTRETRAFLSQLRAGRYDMTIDAQGLFRSGFLSLASGAPLRIGYAEAPEGAHHFYTRKLPVSAKIHAVERMDRLARFACDEAIDDPRERFSGITSRPKQRSGPLAASLLGVCGENTGPDLRLYADPDEIAALRDDPAIGDADPIIVAPTSRWPGKRWPASRFAEVVRALAREGRGPIVIVGGPGEREQCAPVLELASKEGPVVDLVGRTSVGRLLALVSIGRLVVANDSAPLHMAVGFGVPTVALFGPTDTARVGPYGREHEVIQHLDGVALRPGDHKNDRLGRDLMKRITVDEVLERALAAPRVPGGMPGAERGSSPRAGDALKLAG